MLFHQIGQVRRIDTDIGLRMSDATQFGPGERVRSRRASTCASASVASRNVRFTAVGLEQAVAACRSSSTWAWSRLRRRPRSASTRSARRASSSISCLHARVLDDARSFRLGALTLIFGGTFVRRAKLGCPSFRFANDVGGSRLGFARADRKDLRGLGAQPVGLGVRFSITLDERSSALRRMSSDASRAVRSNARSPPERVEELLLVEDLASGCSSRSSSVCTSSSSRSRGGQLLRDAPQEAAHLGLRVAAERRSNVRPATSSGESRGVPLMTRCRRSLSGIPEPPKEPRVSPTAQSGSDCDESQCAGQAAARAGVAAGVPPTSSSAWSASSNVATGITRRSPATPSPCRARSLLLDVLARALGHDEHLGTHRLGARRLLTDPADLTDRSVLGDRAGDRDAPARRSSHPA